MRRVLLCAIIAVLAGCGGGGEQDPFAYDAKAPLDVRENTRWDSGDVAVHSITYTSPKGGRVPALVLVPDGKGPFAGLILQHGMPGRSSDMEALGEDSARLGAVVVLIDAPFARHGGFPVAGSTSATAASRSS